MAAVAMVVDVALANAVTLDPATVPAAPPPPRMLPATKILGDAPVPRLTIVTAPSRDGIAPLVVCASMLTAAPRIDVLVAAVATIASVDRLVKALVLVAVTVVTFWDVAAVANTFDDDVLPVTTIFCCEVLVPDRELVLEAGTPRRFS